MMEAKKPYLLVIIIVVLYTAMYVISKAAFDHGMNTFVFIFYRQAAASLLLLPVALFLERFSLQTNDEKELLMKVGQFDRITRKNLQSLSSRLLLKLFFCALIGNTFGLNLINASMKLTSATVASAVGNSTPVITFCLALLLRMEVVKLRSYSGIAKLTGVGLCLAGVLVIAFYNGPSLSLVNHHHRAFIAHAAQASSPPKRRTWIIGTFLLVLSNAAWSLWIILQAVLLKEYPNKMLVTVVQCVFSAMQSFVTAVVAERDFSRWKLRLDIGLVAIVYSGFVATGVSNYLQVWCVEMKGPVFLAFWSPLVFILTIFCSSFFLGETIHLGSIVGGILLVGGLYSVLCGKSKESKITPCSRVDTIDGAQEHEHRKHQEEDKEESAEEISTFRV
ncbi:hypothetical protein ACP4OV_012824 [Aristida adscensionis]